jgi:hypothetical protein
MARPPLRTEDSADGSRVADGFPIKGTRPPRTGHCPSFSSISTLLRLCPFSTTNTGIRVQHNHPLPTLHTAPIANASQPSKDRVMESAPL